MTMPCAVQATSNAFSVRTKKRFLDVWQAGLATLAMLTSAMIQVRVTVRVGVRDIVRVVLASVAR